MNSSRDFDKPDAQLQSQPCRHKAGSMKCRECVDFLLDYADGILPANQREVFEQHLRDCPNCENYVDNYKKAAALTAGLGRCERAGISDQVPEGLIQAILRARRNA